MNFNLGKRVGAILVVCRLNFVGKYAPENQFGYQSFSHRQRFSRKGKQEGSGGIIGGSIFWPL